MKLCATKSYDRCFSERKNHMAIVGMDADPLQGNSSEFSRTDFNSGILILASQ